MDGDGPLFGQLDDDLVDNGHEDLPVRGTVQHPDIVRRGLHDFDDRAQITETLVDDRAAQQVPNGRIEATELKVIAGCEDIATRQALGVIETVSTGEAHAGALGRDGEGLDGRGALPLEGGRSPDAPASTR